jgi:hypothetical protein
MDNKNDITSHMRAKYGNQKIIKRHQKRQENTKTKIAQTIHKNLRKRQK